MNIVHNKSIIFRSFALILSSALAGISTNANAIASQDSVKLAVYDNGTVSSTNNYKQGALTSNDFFAFDIGNGLKSQVVVTKDKKNVVLVSVDKQKIKDIVKEVNKSNNQSAQKQASKKNVTSVATKPITTTIVDVATLDKRVTMVGAKLAKVEEKMSAGIASAAALEQAPFVPGKWTYAVGSAHFNGETAFGSSIRRTADNGRHSANIGVSTSTEGEAIFKIALTGILY